MNKQKKIRWWPLWILLGANLSAILWLWLAPDLQRQNRVVFSILTELLSGGAVVIWLMFFSRLPLGRRFLMLGLLALPVLAFGLTVQIHGVSGDIVPILAWRWSPPPGSGLDTQTRLAEATVEQAPEGPHYAQFYGNHRDGKLAGPELARDWESRPPREIWRQTVGAGWSGFAIWGHLAVTQEQRDEEEMVTCYDLRDGRSIWAHGDSARYSTGLGGTGPRATPTIAGGRVYSLGALGLLNCLDLLSGRLIWQVHLVEQHGGNPPEWGYSASPLVYGDLVVISPGGSDGRATVAHDRHDGHLVWQAGDGKTGYSSPQLRRLADFDQVLVFYHDGLAGHHPLDGRILWRFPWPGERPTAADPVVLDERRLLVSSGYGVGSKLLKIHADGDGFRAELLYESPRFKAKFANFIYHRGVVFGLDDGVLCCFDVETGERKWRRGRYGHGQLLLVKDLLLVQSEKGKIHLVEADPERYSELASFEVLKGKAWNHMALAGDRLLLRNHKQAACLALPLAAAQKNSTGNP